MNLRYYLFEFWQLLVDHALPLTAFVLLAVLVPRLGRLVVRFIEARLKEDEESTKARLALVGALVYVVEVVAFFLIVLAALSNLGVPPLGAALPATVVSAAVGFGSQKIIGDFLAGFFILSEKQFGVGDYISVDGVQGVEGTVVAVTLRTTKLRTSTGEVVMIPNGSTGVVTNFSQDWSRAVVDLAVPVQVGETLADISSRVETVSARAVADPEVAADVAGEVEVLPATGLVAPTVAGQPWQVNFRVLVTVNPSRQWAVERSIRSQLIAAFWDHYNLGSASEIPQPLAGPAGVTGAPEVALATGAAMESTAVLSAHTPDPTDLDAKDDGPGRPSESESADVPAEEPGDGQRAGRGMWRNNSPSGAWESILTWGGRVRASTTWLIAALAAVGALWLASYSPEHADAGFLSPSKWRTESTASTTAVPSTSEPAPVASTVEQTTGALTSAVVEPAMSAAPVTADATAAPATPGAPAQTAEPTAEASGLPDAQDTAVVNELQSGPASAEPLGGN